MFSRLVEPLWKKKFAAPYVHLVFGARQTGKSTLLRQLLPETAVWLDFSRPAERAEYLRSPDLLVPLCRAQNGGHLACTGRRPLAFRRAIRHNTSTRPRAASMGHK
jgi:hypothetical protein